MVVVVGPEGGEGGGGVKEDVNNIINIGFYVFCSLLEDLCTQNVITKKQSKVNKPQMRMSAWEKLLEVPLTKSRQIYEYML